MAASPPEAGTCLNAGPSCRLRRFRRRGLGLVAAEVGDRAAPAFGGARLADVAAVEDQPVVRADAERAGHLLFELLLDREDRLARREAGAVADAEDMGVDREGLRPQGRVHIDR